MTFVCSFIFKVHFIAERGANVIAKKFCLNVPLFTFPIPPLSPVNFKKFGYAGVCLCYLSIAQYILRMHFSLNIILTDRHCVKVTK